MKKIALYGLSAMFALSFVACDDYKEPNPEPQTNPQESIFKASDVSVNGDLSATEVYDLTKLQDDGEMINVATVKAVAALPTGCTLAGNVEISADNFETAFPVASTAEKVADEDAYRVVVSPADLEEVYFTSISQSPAENEIKVRVLPMTVIGKQYAFIGGTTNFAGPYTMKVKPEVRYSYLYTPGNSNGWNQGASQPLYGLDTFNFDGYAILDGEFKFSTQLNWDGTNYGLGEGEGKLSDASSAVNLSATPAGLYYLTANLEELTYTSYLVTTIGVVGSATPNGWDLSTPLAPDNGNLLVWKGVVTFGEGAFKFRANNDWTANLGGSYSNLAQGAADLPSPGEGTYEVTLHLDMIPYSCTLVKQ